MLIQIAAQLRRADEEFRNHATHLLEVLSAQDGKPHRGRSESLPKTFSEIFSKGVILG